jgi:hypothetical protein
MRWIDKQPPIYVHHEDTWYNESNKLTYQADIFALSWYCIDKEWEQPIPFPQKTKIKRWYPEDINPGKK